MTTPGGYSGGGAYLINPSFAVNPFETVQGVLIGSDLVCILPSSIYPRQLLGVNYVGPTNATQFEVFLGSPTNKIDSSNLVANNTLRYGVPFLVPPGTQVFCYWRNAVVITPVAATIAETVAIVAGSSTSVSVVTGAGTTVGDRLYAFHHDNFCNVNGELTNMSAPTGTLGAGSWTPIANSNNGGGACGDRLWYATCVAGGAHTVTSNQLDGSSSNGLIVVRASGVSFHAASAGQLKAAGATGAVVTAPDISGGVTQQPLDQLFRLYAINSGLGAPVPTFTVPAGYTLRQENIRATSCDQALYSQLMAAGATSVGALTTNNTQTAADAYATMSLVIRGTPLSSSLVGTVTFQMSAA